MSLAALNSIRSFLPLTDRVGTAGQPTAEQFADVAAAGYEVVINLALPTSSNALPDEAAVVAGHGMDYVHIPVNFDAPSIDDVRRFFQAMDAARERKVFVHCAMNMRVSAFMYLYRTVRDGTDPAVAQRDLRRLWIPNPTWQQFIENAAKELGTHGPQPSS